MSGDDNGLVYGDEVVIPWGVGEIRGTIREVYGSPPRRHVVILLSPETSDIVDEPTTIAMPLDAVKKASIA